MMNSSYGDPARLVQVISMLQLDKNSLAEERKAIEVLLSIANAKVAALETAANTNLRAVRTSEQSRGKLTAAGVEIEALQKENSVRREGRQLCVEPRNLFVVASAPLKLTLVFFFSPIPVPYP